MINLNNIGKYYKLSKEVQVDALKNINLTIHAGEDVVIVGKSGSGKTTLMNVITCVDDYSEGIYLFDDINIAKQSRSQLATLRNAKFGFIFQNFNLMNNLTAFENIELPLIYRKMSKSDRKKKVLEIAKQVGIEDRIEHKPSELSGGEKQRVAIARALVNDPEVIIADEPTGALDEKTGEAIIKILKDLNKQGKTIIMVTHDLDIAAMSPRRITLADGVIVSDEREVNV
ncbi:MAG: ABC transporter ATP-binding protein [Erysipelotrichaceae bacterium]